MARIRTFLAIDLGDKIRNRLVALQEELATEAADVSWVEAANLHITLLFLGEVDTRELPDICRATQRAVETLPAFTVSIEGTGCFPNARRPRVLWVGIGAGRDEVCEVHRAIEEPLLDLGCYRREARAFTPHVTLGRIKGEETQNVIAGALARHESYSAGEAMIRDIRVMSSELTRHVPTYTVLARAKLATA